MTDIRSNGEMAAAVSTTDRRDAPQEPSVLDGRRGILVCVLVALFLLAAAVRLYSLDTVGISPVRDFNSAIFARDFYFQRADGIEPWRREMARATAENLPTLEPPVTEWLVSILYSLAGGEDLRLGRVLTSGFWLLGGWFLYLAVWRLVSTDAAVLAFAYYLFVPQGILLSRSVQPDALMMLGFLACLYLTMRYHESPSRQRLLLAAALSAATVLYRPLVLPALFGAFIIPTMQRRGVWRSAVDRQALIYALSVALPAVLYYGYGTFVARHFSGQTALSFRPGLLWHREYWQGWWELAVWVTGLAPLVLAACGTTLLRPWLARPLVIGLLLGYIAFGLVFTMHIHTHHYYHAQLIAIVAIAASPAAALLAHRVVATTGLATKLVAVLAVGLLIGLPSVREWQLGLREIRYESPAVAREIGHIVGHSQRVVFVAPHYGMSLQYLGELTGTSWPLPINYWLYRTPGERELSIAERLERLRFVPEYFVITSFGEFDLFHQDLAAYLATRCTLKAVAPDYRVYEACEPPG